MCCADKEVASVAAEDVAFRAVVMDLTRFAAFGEAIAEVRIGAEEGDRGELVGSGGKVSVV